MAATVAVPARPRAVEKASSLVGYLRSRLGEVELRRRLWHMLPGLLPFVLWIIPHDAPTSLRFQLVVGIGGSLAAAVMILKFSQIRRQGEANRDSVMAVLGYAGSGLGMMLLFPGELQLATGVLAVLAFGDGSATLGGLLLGGRRLPWNSKKTVAGSACFLIFGTLMAALVYWGTAHFLPELQNAAPITAGIALFCGLAATLTAAVVESLPVRLNDNIRVGVSASLAILAAHTIAVGWPG